MQIDAIILAGGVGKRLWPQSRRKTPKHLLKVDGENTLLYLTIKRALLLDPQRILIVTNKEHINEVNAELEKVKGSNEYLNLIEKQDIVFIVIKEPISKNTAPAIAVSSYILNEDGNQNIVAMLPSDHLITNNESFVQAIKSAYAIAKKGYIVTLGVAPTAPVTGYGYIETENLKGARWYTVKSFKEKPDRETAERYIKSENYYYNSGILIFKPSDLIAEFEKYMPALASEAQKTVGLKSNSPSFDKILEQIYKNVETESIDYGILEKSKNVAVAPANFNWSDLGSWSSLYDVLDKDGDGNAILGDVFSINSKGVLVRAGKKLITLVGVNDLIVIDTDDATLICNKNSAEDVKKLVNLLEEKGRKKLI